MDLHYKREVTVGTLVILGLVGFVLGTMWLRGRSVREGEPVRFRFADVGNLKEGSSIRVSGVEMGKIQRIQFVKPGDVEVLGDVRRDVALRQDATARIITLTLAAGDAAVDLSPGSSGAPLPRDAVIEGISQSGFTDLATTLGTHADSLLRATQALLDAQTIAQLRATLAALEGTLAASRQTFDLLNDPNRGPTAELTRTMAAFRQLSTRLDSTLGNPALQRALSRSDSLVTSLTTMTRQFAVTGARLDTLLAGVKRGQGTIGRMASDTMLYHNLVRLSASLDSVMRGLQRNPGKIPVTVRIGF